MPRALIIGGSLGGLFAANLLHDQGWDVEVFEKVGDDLAARGAGIGTHVEMVKVLAELGIEMHERLGVVIPDRICVDKEGRELFRCHWAHTMSAWANVYRPLKDRFPAERYHFGKAFASLQQDDKGVTARFEDGTSATGDLLIGADGLRSAVRGQIMPHVEPQYAGYVAWRSIVEESLIPQRSRDWLGEGYWFVLPKGEMFLCYQVPAKDLSRTGRDWNYVWYRPVTETQLADFCTDASGKCHGTGIPPPLIRPDVTAYIKREARELLPPHLAELINVSEPFFQAVFDIESPRLTSGRVALLGDAAFVARPHVGMGVTKGALDAVCLSKSLGREETLESALARYDRLRSEFGRRCVARARRLGSYIEARSRPDKGWTPAQLDQRPERVLQEVALALAEIPELQIET